MKGQNTIDAIPSLIESVYDAFDDKKTHGKRFFGSEKSIRLDKALHLIIEIDKLWYTWSCIQLV